MRVLHVAPYSPVPPIFGGALRTFYMLKGLAQRHEVTFVTFGNERDEEALREEFDGIVKSICVVHRQPISKSSILLGLVDSFLSRASLFSASGRSPEMQATLDRLCESERYDAAVFEFPMMGLYRLNGDIPRILDEHNVEYNNFRRMYLNIASPVRKLFFLREFRKTFREEIDVCRRMDGVFVTSHVDRRILEENVADKEMFVVPNGVDTGYFHPYEEDPEPYTMTFTGTMDYVPNRDAMLYFLDKIFPLIKREVPEAKIRIVGSNPPEVLRRRASNDVIVAGYVADVRPYVARSSVCIVPLRMGSGTRLKILEGLAMKKAIVTTSIGCEGIDVKNGKHLAIADDPVVFAQKTVELLQNKNDADLLGEQGYRLVTSRYDWAVVAEQMEEAMSLIVRRKRQSTSEAVTRAQPSAEITEPIPAKASVDVGPLIKVLVYHRVVEHNAIRGNYSWNVSPSQLRMHLKFLEKWGYTCIDFEDIAMSRRGELSLPKKPVILTFDDGYDDVFERVLPCMNDFGAKAALFILGDRSTRTNVWDEPKGFVGASLMNDERIIQLHKAGFEIGSHSMTHPKLTSFTPERAWEEVSRSKEVLEDLIQAPVLSFAYPFGDSNEELVGLVREAGYIYACGVFSGPPRFAANLFNIRRIPMTNRTNLFDFALKMLTPYEYYSWIRWEAGERLSPRGERRHTPLPFVNVDESDGENHNSIEVNAGDKL